MSRGIFRAVVKRLHHLQYGRHVSNVLIACHSPPRLLPDPLLSIRLRRVGRHVFNLGLMRVLGQWLSYRLALWTLSLSTSRRPWRSGGVGKSQAREIT